jgi:hypothetical protein
MSAGWRDAAVVGGNRIPFRNEEPRTGLSTGEQIHDAFAAQVLSTPAAWKDAGVRRDRLGLDAPLRAVAPVSVCAAGGPGIAATVER